MSCKTFTGVRATPKRALCLAAVAGAAGLSLAPALAAAADESPAGPASAADEQRPATEVSGVDVTAERRGEPESPKYVAPLLDTPQTITVVPKEVIEAQNLMTLRDILSTVPGITFGAGEGGGGYGDSINLRGYSANNDITVDGVRDSAQYTRSDPFNLEQIEVTNGANGVYAGSGSVGGSINLVSKQPGVRDFVMVSAGVGTDSYYRATVDANRPFGESAAGRLNLMVHGNDVPGRDVEKYRRWGVAPSLSIGLGTATQMILQAFYQDDDNTPQYGVPYGSNTVVNGPLPGVDPSTYFGYRNIDSQQSQVAALTSILQHAFSDTLSVRNLTRYQAVDQIAIVNPPQGTWCLAGGVNAQTGAACAPAVPSGSYTPSGPRGTSRDTENRIFYNQTDFTARFETGGLAHVLVGGVALSEESFRLDRGNVQRSATGATPVYPAMSLDNPDNVYTGPLNYIRSALSDGERSNQAVYLFDVVELGEQFEINGGVRYEHNEGSFKTDAFSTVVGPTLGVVTPGATARNEDDLISWRLGLVYKPTPDASLYLAYGNSVTPSQATVIGGCTLSVTAGNCNVDPEEAENIEVGGKWNALDGRVLLTGSVFRNERSAFRVNSDIPGVEQVLAGRSRVDGVSLGAAGRIRDNLYVYANYTWLDSQLLQSANAAAVAAGLDFRAGDPLPNTPEHAFSIWTTYDVNPRWQLGYGVTYSGEYAYQRAGTAATPAPLLHAPDYYVHNLAVTWRVSPAADLRLNVRNVTDEEYYTRIRSTGSLPIGGFGWATPGDARNATLTLNYRF